MLRSSEMRVARAVRAATHLLDARAVVRAFQMRSQRRAAKPLPALSSQDYARNPNHYEPDPSLIDLPGIDTEDR